ncbi:zinc finger, CCHC-type containing protein [Tanacetum coccineum]
MLKMKSYLDILERLGYAMPNELGVSLILNSLNKDYDQFVQNYNMHNMGKTIAELHAMLNLHEKSIPKKVETPAVLAIRAGKIQKDKKKLQGAKGKGEGKNKLAYAPKTKIPSSPKRDNPAKDSVCHHCNEVGLGGEMSVPTGLRRSRKLKHGALSLYMGNGMRVVVEAIRNFDLVLPNARILNMVPIKKVERTPYEIWHGKAPKLSYLRVWGCVALVKRDTPDKLDSRSIKCSLRKASWYKKSHGLLESNRKERDTFTLATRLYGFFADVEDYELMIYEHPNSRFALSDPKFYKWLEAMNRKMQSMKDNQVWVLVDLPPNGRTVGSKWLFKKKTNMDGNVHTLKARLVAKGYTQTYGVDYGETFSPVADIRAI